MKRNYFGKGLAVMALVAAPFLGGCETMQYGGLSNGQEYSKPIESNEPRDALDTLLHLEERDISAMQGGLRGALFPSRVGELGSVRF